MKKPVLVVLAAGMGSRYGGLKQIESMGNHGEAILDYSVYDAWMAGFETVVLIIKESIRKDFTETVGARLQNAPVEIRYAFQELEMLPDGFSVPKGRVKPWGTSHAVLCAKDAIGDAPFVVINADDYYGRTAYSRIFDALNGTDADESFMMGYELDKTVTEHGSVTRGICAMDASGNLMEVVERTCIEKHADGIRFSEDSGISWKELPGNALVSMNMWGFRPGFLSAVQDHFSEFLENALKENPQKAEFILPNLVQTLLQQRELSVKVLSTPDKWYGVTYAADKPAVVDALREMTKQGLYPDGLWTQADIC